MTQQHQYKLQTITETIEVEASKYTEALARAMENTKQMLSAQILGDSWGLYVPNQHEIKVDFDAE